jgi:Fe-S-cluster containining protein
MSSDASISRVRWLCHKLCPSLCVEDKRRGLHRELLRYRPHWSISKRDEQLAKIDLGERIPFDIALPLPAKDRGFAETAEGVDLFREIFRCQRCGRCCFTEGAGLVLEESDFARIAEFIGSTKLLKSYCRYDKGAKAWILRQPCPFYDKTSRSCKIYPVRPQTCFQYPLHPPLKEMPFNLAVDAFCPAARQLAKDTLGWWIICENNWARLLQKMQKRQL